MLGQRRPTLVKPWVDVSCLLCLRLMFKLKVNEKINPFSAGTDFRRHSDVYISQDLTSKMAPRTRHQNLTSEVGPCT